MTRRKSVKRTLQPWTYIQAAVPQSVKQALEEQADADNVSVAEIGGRVLTEYAKHRAAWCGAIEPDPAAEQHDRHAARMKAAAESRCAWCGGNNVEGHVITCTRPMPYGGGERT